MSNGDETGAGVSSYGTPDEDVIESTEKSGASCSWVRPVAALGLLGLAALAATYGGPLLRNRKGLRFIQSTPAFGYQGLDGDTLVCAGKPDFLHKHLPRWDPDFTDSDDDFYNACYHSFRCCTTTGNSNGCYVSDNLGPRCRGCLANNPPLMVKKPCADFVNECGGQPGKKGCGMTEPNEYTKTDLMNDNGVPVSTTPEWAVTFNNIDTCWNQFGSKDKRSKAFANKCWDVVTWCHGNAKVCPRDPHTSGHVYCKHCVYFGFASADSGDDPAPTPAPVPPPPPPPPPAPKGPPPTVEIMSGDIPFTLTAGQCVSVDGDTACVRNIAVAKNTHMLDIKMEDGSEKVLDAAYPGLTHERPCGLMQCDYQQVLDLSR